MPDLDDPPAPAPVLDQPISPPRTVPDLPVEALPTAEPFELESFEDPTHALKAAVDVLTSVAEAISDEPTAKAEKSDGETPAQVAAKLSAKVAMPEPVQKVPSWAAGNIPGSLSDGVTPFRFPKGREIMFLRLRAGTTDVPQLGDRQLICWRISPGDMRWAQGDMTRVSDEMIKQMIRAIDGHAVNWAEGVKHNPDVLWGQIGQKNRWLLTRMFTQLNTHTPEELKDFFEHCIAVVTTG